MRPAEERLAGWRGRPATCRSDPARLLRVGTHLEQTARGLEPEGLGDLGGGGVGSSATAAASASRPSRPLRPPGCAPPRDPARLLRVGTHLEQTARGLEPEGLGDLGGGGVGEALQEWASRLEAILTEPRADEPIP